MLMRNKFFFIFVLSGFIHKAHASTHESLITMIQNIQNNNSIFLDDTIHQTRAFDLLVSNTTAAVSLALLTTTNLGNSAFVVPNCAFHPTAKWIGLVTNQGPNGAIVDCSASGTSLFTRSQNIFSHANTLKSIAWHPSGDYFAYVGFTAGGIEGKVVAFNQDTGLLSNLTTSCNITHGANLYTAEWSPNGKYLAIGGSGISNANHIQTFSFDGYALWNLPQASIT